MENEDKIKTLTSENRHLYNESMILSRKMEEIKVQINENVHKIQQLCHHVYVSEVVYGERTNYICSKCGHYR